MNWFNLERSSPFVDINIIVAIAIFCWFIWKSRNDVVFGNDSYAHSKIVFYACKLIREVNEQGNDQVEGWSTPGTSFWAPPPPGVMKVNVDGAFCSDNGKARAEVVMRYLEDSFLFALAEPGMAMSARLFV